MANDFFKEVNRHFRRLEAAADRAEVTALNRAGTSAYGAAVKSIASGYNVSQKTLRKYFRTIRANRNNKRFTVIAERKGLSFYSGGSKLFKIRQTKKGIKFEVKKGSPQFIPSGFVQTMKTGHKGAFVRKKGQQISTRAGNLTKHTEAIKEIYALNVGNVFFANRTRKDMEQQFFERFKIEFEYNLQRQMSRVR